MAYDFCQLTPEEASRAASQYLSAAQWFANPDNALRNVSDCNFESTDVYDY
ncbi:hypothetical protein CBS101457_006892 [Exobasidium rhododendri]|nr:hypothetical protein CBS101457_006892 [Exobasidium rhododendri]